MNELLLEPVLYQRRSRNDTLSPWGPWSACDREDFDRVTNKRVLGEANCTDVRALYDIPPNAKHWHDLYRKESQLRRDDAARYGEQILVLETAAPLPDDFKPLRTGTFPAPLQYKDGMIYPPLPKQAEGYHGDYWTDDDLTGYALDFWGANVSVVRTAVADYIRSEGCSCCRDRQAHEEHTEALAKLLDVKPYDDNSGYDFAPYRTVK